MFKAQFIFSKTGMMKYISHLDLMRLFIRAFRRADFALKFTEGFSPHPKLSMKRALKLGVESENEEASIALKEFIPPQDFIQRLQNQLPEGINIKSVYYGEMGSELFFNYGARLKNNSDPISP